ncbi:MAG: hypothetical protein QG553_67 [Patescibacteria group bacterium]|nr:hypothetical protein [Patescibacteria group bacterium]
MLGMIASHENSVETAKQPSSRVSEDVRRGRKVWNAVLLASAVAAATGGVASRVGEINESRQTEIPTVEEVQDNPDAFVERTVKPGDSFDGIAMEYTPNGHDYKAGAYNLDSQIDGNLMAGDKVMVPPTTTPPAER